jgi:uncharacterized protein (TIGR02145 family)
LPNDSVISDLAEIAVGCGAKTVNGEWLSFLCFNLGARTLWIDDQKNYSISFPTPNDPTTGLHYYVSNEEYLYGDLYQWGRIGDGHQFRVGTNNTATPPSNQVNFGSLTTTDYERGSLIGSVLYYPTDQIKRTSTTWYGKFIYNGTDFNWANLLDASFKDQLWRIGRYATNDPCTKIKKTYDGTHPFSTNTADANYVGTTDNETNDWFSWYPTTANHAGGGTGSTGWRIPTQDEWADLYRGGITSGLPDNAIANTWEWNSTNGKGYEIRPDGITTTLFLPAGSNRTSTTGQLCYQTANGGYWSSTILGSSAYYMFFNIASVEPARTHFRSYGFAVRCIKQY